MAGGARWDSQSDASSMAGSARPRALYGAASIPNVGKGTENQDAFAIASSTGRSKNFIGVFDGHGEMGGHIARYAGNALPQNLLGNSGLKSDPRSAFENAYRKTQSQIVRDHGEAADFSGTTAVAAYQHRDRLLVANVGDSRAVLGRCRTGDSKKSRASLRAVDLSSDHKPSRPDEKQRILDHGGRVQQGVFPVSNVLGGVSYIRAGPERVVDRSGLGGLAMSRSLGDVDMHPYVSSKPEIHERRLDRRDKVLILGSDGVWDHVNSQEAVDIARRHTDPNAAAREITSAARKRWTAETEGSMTDDITAVVTYFDHDRAASTQRSGKAPSTTSTHRSLSAVTGNLDGLRQHGKNLMHERALPWQSNDRSIAAQVPERLPTHMLPRGYRRR